MLFRRRPADKNRKIARAAAAVFEPLEGRRLLTALINGTFQGTGTAYDGLRFFEYRQANGNAVIKISVVGNITAEFIGAQYNPLNASQLSLSDLTPATVTDSTVFLFSIYVVKADMDCAISIAQVPDLTADDRPMDPFGGTMTLRYQPAEGGATATVGLQGAAYIGGQTPTGIPAPGNNIPLIWTEQRSFGMRPASAGEMLAGLEVAEGNDLGRFYLGGTITGIVDLPRNMDTFYANNVLTGDATGIPITANRATGFNEAHFANRNFYVRGDIRNVLAGNSFGTVEMPGGNDTGSVDYKTGFRFWGNGRVGEILAGGDSFLGQAVVQNSTAVQGPGIAQQEFERRGFDGGGDFSFFDPQFVGNELGIGDGETDPRFWNDSFDTAQFLGTAFSQQLNSREVIQIRGEHIGITQNANDPAADPIDFYAVPLLAGQSMEIQLIDLFPAEVDTAPPRLGIFDPEGRLVYSDYNNDVYLARSGSRVRWTADRPGSWRIAVGIDGDRNFNGLSEAGIDAFSSAGGPYELRIRKIGDLALGGLVARNHIATLDRDTQTGQLDRGLEVLNGDMGEVFATNNIFSLSAPWYVPTGNFRSMVGGSTSILITEGGVTWFEGWGPDLRVRKGSVGLLRTTNASLANGMLSINDDDIQFDLMPGYLNDLRRVAEQYPNAGVGTSIQLVDAAGHLAGNLISNGPIGVIRAASMSTLDAGDIIFATPMAIVANADRRGSDGIIDLIDIDTAMSAPAIVTGPNGNVRYIRAGGDVYRDIFFGGGQPEATQYSAGQTPEFTDDSGTRFILSPLPLVEDPFAPPGQTGFIDPGSLSVLTYPIRYSGGQVIMDVTVTPGITGGGGLDIRAITTGARGTVEISQITLGGAIGVPIVFDPVDRLYDTVPAAATRTVDVIARGSANIDIWSIISNTPGQTLTTVDNRTAGEIVNIGLNGTLVDIATLQAETIGLARSNARTAVEGFDILDTVYPFNNQRNLIRVSDLNSARSRRGLGNILADNINSVVANYDRTNVAGLFEGINGPIVSRGGGDALTGNIVSVQIGEGLLSSGTGEVGFSGLYASAIIDSVSGSGADIRGDIIATGAVARVLGGPAYVIGDIRLNNGSIVDADIMTTPFEQALETWPFGITFLTGADTIDQPVYDIRSIRLDGLGGIIGAKIATNDIGLTTINGGFGVFNTHYVMSGPGVEQGIVTDGYGIRNSTIDGGASILRIDARGTGKRIDTQWFSSNVRASERYSYDPYSGVELDEFNDLHRALGTSAANPKIKAISDAGVIMDSQFFGSRNLGTMTAHRIIARNVFDPLTGVRLTPGDPAYPMRVAFGNGVSSITTRDVVDGLSLTAGSLGTFSPGADVMYSDIFVSGRVKKILANGALRGTTRIEVTGVDGQIDYLRTRRSLFSTVIVSQDIKTLAVGTYLGSSRIDVGKNIGTLTIGNSMETGALVDVTKTLTNLVVGDDIQAGATIRANKIDKIDIGGQLLGNIVIP